MVEAAEEEAGGAAKEARSSRSGRIRATTGKGGEGEYDDNAYEQELPIGAMHGFYDSAIANAHADALAYADYLHHTMQQQQQQPSGKGSGKSSKAANSSGSSSSSNKAASDQQQGN